MATQYTSTLKLALPTQGELDGTWGDLVNDNITSMVEEAIAGLATINTWSTNSHTLTVANGTTSESRSAMLVLTDTGTALTGAGEVICPTAAKIYVVKNDTGQTITIKTSGGTGVDILDGTAKIVFCDGTNVVQASASLTGLGVTATAAELNVLDGVTATTAELNVLDGITATTTELNYTDGVTSNIQTQLDSVNDKLDGTTPVTGIDINSGSIAGSGTEITLNTSSGAPSGGTVAAGEPVLDLTNNKLYSSTDGTDVVEIGGATFTGITGNIEATSSLLKIFEGSSYVTSDYHVLENSNESTGIAVFDHNGTVPVGLRVRYRNAAPTSGTSAQAYLLCSDTSATRFYIIPNGSVYNVTGTYGTISDVNLKQQIIDASSQWDDIKAVQVRNYKYNTDVNESGDSDELWRIGVIAQELETVSPTLVEETYEQDGGMYKAVKTSVLHMKALKALQEAMDRIETLESKVSALEAN